MAKLVTFTKGTNGSVSVAYSGFTNYPSGSFTLSSGDNISADITGDSFTIYSKAAPSPDGRFSFPTAAIDKSGSSPVLVGANTTALQLEIADNFFLKALGGGSGGGLAVLLPTLDWDGRNVFKTISGSSDIHFVLDPASNLNSGYFELTNSGTALSKFNNVNVPNNPTGTHGGFTILPWFRHDTNMWMEDKDGIVVPIAIPVANTAPYATSVAFTGTAAESETLTGTYVYNDADSDVEGTTTMQWYRSDNTSALNRTAITGATGATYVLQSADIGKYIQYSVVPVAATGVTTGVQVYSAYSAVITANTAPTASSVAFTGTQTQGQTLTGTYTYGDAQSDPQGATIKKWYRSDDNIGTGRAAISGATNTTYVLQSADVGKFIQYAVTPIATVGVTNGVEIFSAFSGAISAISNFAPVASSVAFTGTQTQGQVLTGTYVYNDTESDAEGTSTFKWYRSNDNIGTGKAAISGATLNTYTLQAGDVGKYIQFAVTPVALTGTSPGTEVLSSYSGSISSSSPSLLLDDSAIGSIVARAYSLRKLKTGATRAVALEGYSPTVASADYGFDGSGNFDDAAVAAALTGYKVLDTWYDQSGNGQDAGSGGLTAFNVIAQGAINGRSTVWMSSLGQAAVNPIVYPAALTGTGNWAVFIVFLNAANLATAATAYLVTEYSALPAGDMLLFTTNTIKGELHDGTVHCEDTSAADNNTHLLVGLYDGSHMSIRTDGTAIANVAETGINVDSGDGYGRIGGYRGGLLDTTLIGYVAEVIICNADATAECVAIENNIKAYYGL